jgi:hypothetical protein
VKEEQIFIRMLYQVKLFNGEYRSSFSWLGLFWGAKNPFMNPGTDDAPKDEGEDRSLGFMAACGYHWFYFFV